MSEPIPDWAARLYGEFAVRNIELEQKMADLGDAVSQVTDVLSACEDRIRAQEQLIAQLRDQHSTTVTENDAAVSKAADDLLARLEQTKALLAEDQPEPAGEPVTEPGPDTEPGLGTEPTADPAPADPAAPAGEVAATVDLIANPAPAEHVEHHADGDHSGDRPV